MHDLGTTNNFNLPFGDTFPTIDLAGSPRIQCEQIDIGPYEIEGLANQVDVKIPQDTVTVCPELNGEFISEHCGIAVTYQWQEETAPNSWSNLQTQPKQTVSETGNYRVVATQVACGTADTAYSLLENHPEPQPNLGADRNLDINDSLILDPGTFESYNWGTGETTPTLTLKTRQNGDTTLWVSVIDNNGCVGRDSVTITVTGVHNVNILSQLGIQFYPNPTSQFLHIQNIEQVQKIEILSLQGQLMLSGIKNGTSSIDLSNLPNGVYIVNLETKLGLVQAKIHKK